MTQFQLVMLLFAVIIFSIFFKQLFSGNHPKRGVDFEPKMPDENIGGVSRYDKVFKKVENQDIKKDRTQELFDLAKNAIDKGDKEEAKKAINALLIREPNNTEALRILGTLYLEDKEYEKAIEEFKKVLENSKDDDLTHNNLANALNKVGKAKEAIEHHKIAIELDKSYAPYYYNYANTLYDLGKKDEALSLYKKALELEPNFNDAKKMISEIENDSNK